MVEWSITAVLKTVELKGSGGSNPSLSAKRMLTHSLFSFWATPKTASREGLKRQELALVSGKHSLGAGVAKQREKSDKSAPHRFAMAPRRAARDVGALCATKSRTLPQIHFGSQCATERVYRYLPAKVGLKKSHFGKQSLTECALRHPPCQSELAELREPAICLDIFRSRPAPLSPYGKISLSLIPMRSRHKPDIESTVQREL